MTRKRFTVDVDGRKAAYSVNIMNDGTERMSFGLHSPNLYGRHSQVSSRKKHMKKHGYHKG